MRDSVTADHGERVDHAFTALDVLLSSTEQLTGGAASAGGLSAVSDAVELGYKSGALDAAVDAVGRKTLGVERFRH